MATLNDLIDRLERISQDTSAIEDLANDIGSKMVEEAKKSLFLPKSGKLNRRTGKLRSAKGEPPAYDKGGFYRNTTHFVKVNKSGATILTLQNNAEDSKGRFYGGRVEVDYKRPFLSYGRDKVLEDRGLVERTINRVFHDYFKRNLG